MPLCCSCVAGSLLARAKFTTASFVAAQLCCCVHVLMHMSNDCVHSICPGSRICLGSGETGKWGNCRVSSTTACSSLPCLVRSYIIAEYMLHDCCRRCHCRHPHCLIEVAHCLILGLALRALGMSRQGEVETTSSSRSSAESDVA